jgi:cell division protein FtsL
MKITGVEKLMGVTFIVLVLSVVILIKIVTVGLTRVQDVGIKNIISEVWEGSESQTNLTTQTER